MEQKKCSKDFILIKRYCPPVADLKRSVLFCSVMPDTASSSFWHEIVCSLIDFPRRHGKPPKHR